MKPLYVFIGRDNASTLRLFRIPEGETEPIAVPPNSITRAAFRVNGFCIDTANPSDPIELVDDFTAVRVRLGLIADLEPTGRKGTVGKLTVYDNLAPNGLAWEQFRVVISSWSVCT